MKKEDKKIGLLKIFLNFLKIGIFIFSGGHAILAIIEKNFVEKKKWLTEDEMVELTVLAETTPGSIAINAATYIGYKKAGIFGSIMAILGIIFPGLFILLMGSVFIEEASKYHLISKAFVGMKLAVGVIILDAAIDMFIKMEKTKMSITICILATILMTVIGLFKINISAVFIIIFFALLNLCVFYFSKIKKGKEGKK